jgi:glutamate/tyrosine decarboxylase-like PLP-dependent enzyme
VNSEELVEDMNRFVISIFALMNKLMLDKIKELEKISRELEPNSAARKVARKKVIEYTEDFLDSIYSLKAFDFTEEKGKGIFSSPISNTPVEIDEAIKLVFENVDTQGLNPASGGHLGYIPGGGIYYSALGDYMADITNRYAGIFFAGPGAVRMENMLIEWMNGIVGYSKEASGNLTTGGSLANLIAIVTARDAHKIKSKDIERTVIYLSEQAHHSIDKSIRIAGTGECIHRFIAIDEHFRIIPDELERLIVEDKKNGLIPWLVIAAAGTTDVGAIDPLDEIGDITNKYNLWFHVDGAYGGFFALTDHGKKLLKGIEKSDSVIIDPHKGLFLPYGLGVVLIKDKKHLYESHHYFANYMQDALKDADELSPADLSPELTKHYRSLRLWLPLKLLGVAPFRACLEEKLLLAQYFYDKIKNTKGFEVLLEPQLSVVVFRYIPESGDVDAFNQRIVDEIHKDGRIFFSSTKINGKFMLRICVLAFRTHLATINLALEIINEKVELVKRLQH